MIILLLIGVLLTILLFPIVRGQEINEEEQGEATTKISTRIKEVFFGPADRSDPADGRPDLYEDQPEEWVFTYQVLGDTSENDSWDPVTYGTVWLNITMGPYTNSTRRMTDIRGRVHYNFTSRFTDTVTGNTFTIPTEYDLNNMTLEVKYQGNDTYYPSWKIKYCTYHREVYWGTHYDGDPICLFLVYGLILSIPIFFVCVVIYLSTRDMKRSFQKFEE